MSFHMQGAPANPKPRGLYPKHVGFLGAAAPAVPGLKPVHFAGAPEQALTFEFAEEAFRDVAGLFRKMREWLIGEHDQETADRVLPYWQINWISKQADDEAGQFSETPETEMTKPADLDARAKDLDAREQKLTEAERKTRHEAHIAFADTLVAGARLPKGERDLVVTLLDALPTDAPDVSFAVGDDTITATPAELLKRILKARSPVVEFGETELGEAPDTGGAIDFATPDDKTADPEGLALHRKAVAFQKANPGTEYMAAVQAVS